MAQNPPGTKLAEMLMMRPQGATMDEIIAATGGPQYNALKRLEGQGRSIRKVKENRSTRYFLGPPPPMKYDVTVTYKGQLTIPKDIRERLGLGRGGGRVRLTVEDDNRVTISAKPLRLSDLAGVLGKPPRSLTLQEIDDAIAKGAIDRFRRATR
jgi:antitoxin PrlF